MDAGAGGVDAAVEGCVQIAVGDDELLAGGQLVVAVGSLGFLQVIGAVVEAGHANLAVLDHDGHALFAGLGDAVVVLVDLNDLHFVAAGGGIVDLELSAVDQGVLGVGLDDVEAVGVGDGAVVGGFVVVAVGQVSIVGVAGGGNDGVLIQNRFVVDDDLVVGFQMIAECLGEDDVEGVAVNGSGVNGVVGSGNFYGRATGAPSASG